MEELLFRFSGYAALFIEAAAVLIVLAGAIGAFVSLVKVTVDRATHGARKAVWRRFGVWLLLGLEFELAADIIRSVIAPTWEDLGKLAIIAVVRTFLNYFLEKDLEAATEERDAVTA